MMQTTIKQTAAVVKGDPATYYSAQENEKEGYIAFLPAPTDLDLPKNLGKTESRGVVGMDGQGRKNKAMNG